LPTQCEQKMGVDHMCQTLDAYLWPPIVGQ
jgi:hypothetical protein